MFVQCVSHVRALFLYCWPFTVKQNYVEFNDEHAGICLVRDVPTHAFVRHRDGTEYIKLAFGDLCTEEYAQALGALREHVDFFAPAFVAPIRSALRRLDELQAPPVCLDCVFVCAISMLNICFTYVCHSHRMIIKVNSTVLKYDMTF